MWLMQNGVRKAALLHRGIRTCRTGVQATTSGGHRRDRAPEEDFVSRAIARWSKCKNIQILGNPEAPRLSITSLKITHDGKDLHYSFIVAVLNDLFGIQARGGCSCAGPYGHTLLGMDMATARRLRPC